MTDHTSTHLVTPVLISHWLKYFVEHTRDNGNSKHGITKRRKKIVRNLNLGNHSDPSKYDGGGGGERTNIAEFATSLAINQLLDGRQKI